MSKCRAFSCSVAWTVGLMAVAAGVNGQIGVCIFMACISGSNLWLGLIQD